MNIPSSVTYNEVIYTVTRIGDNAFWGCTSITGELTIPNTITSIGAYAFSDCTYFIGNLVLSNSLQEIGERGFYRCYFTITTLPNSLTCIGKDAFYGLEWYWCQPDGLLYLDSWCLGYKGDKPTGDIAIQGGTIGIGDQSFWLCNGLTSVNMPNSILYIGKEVFYECTELVSVSLGTTLKRIGSEAFGECYNLSSIVIPNTVTEIEGGAFIGCSNLATVNIPNTLTSISGTLFCRCYNLASISIPNTVTSIEDGAFLWCTNSSDINLPNSITSIGMDAFSCSGLTSIIIPNSVVSIGDRAFADCANLSYAYIGSSVSSIEGRLFNGCSNLIQIEVASDNIKYDSRNNCNAIIYTANNMLIAGCKTTIIPNTITTIGSSAFSECGGLTYMDIPSSVTVIGSDAFSRCRALNEIKFPNTLTTISVTAFVECTALTSINIPNSVTEIGGSAFAWCTGLESVTIGSSVAYLGNQLFESCGSLQSISFLSIIPPIMYDYYEVFPSSNSNLSIYVPYGSVETYKTATNWNHYESRIYPMVYKTIMGYGDNNNLWQFIASPLVEITSPETVDNMMSKIDYDLYQFNPTEPEGQWQNHKADNFDLVNGQGYLYASEEEVNIIFKGEFNEDETKVVELVYDEGSPNAGWNLVGNPFPVSAYINRDYYIMNEDGTGINPVTVPASTPIPPCTGVMVRANGTGETVVFSKTAP